MLVGCSKELTREQWHQNHKDYLSIDAISRTHIMDYRDSPEDYQRRYILKTLPPKQVTEQMRFGQMVDDFLTGGFLPDESMPDDVIVGPTYERRGNDWRDFEEEYKESGLELWTQKEEDRWMQGILDRQRVCFRIADQIADHRDADFYVNASKQSCQPILDVVLPEAAKGKTKPDIVAHNVAVDIKCLKATDVNTWHNSVYSFGYDVQGVMAMMAMPQHIGGAVNVVIKNTEPYNVEVYDLANWLKRGSAIIRETVPRIIAQQWRSPTHGKIQKPDVPGWVWAKDGYQL